MSSWCTRRKLSKYPSLTRSHPSTGFRKPKNCMLMTENQMRKTSVIKMTTASRVPPPRTLKRNFFMLILRRKIRKRRSACRERKEGRKIKPHSQACAVFSYTKNAEGLVPFLICMTKWWNGGGKDLMLVHWGSEPQEELWYHVSYHTYLASREGATVIHTKD